MNAALWSLVVVAASTFIVESAFLGLGSARRAQAAGVLSGEVKLVAYLLVLIGLPADVTFNLVRGTLMFRELPRELLFSSRVKRHVRESTGWRHDKALQWMAFLNVVDPGHIREVE
jgi:hypothetical protein